LGAALAALQVAFGLAEDAVLVTLAAAAIVVGSNWFSASFHAYQAELFPTEARATGIGFTYAWSRMSMVLLNLVMDGVITFSLAAAFGLTVAAFVGVALLIGLFGPLTNARSLEKLA